MGKDLKETSSSNYIIENFNDFLNSLEKSMSEDQKIIQKKANLYISELKDRALYDEACKLTIRIGDYFRDISKFKKAISYYRACLRIKEANIFYHCHAQIGLGDCYWRLGKYKEALDSYISNIEESEIEIYQELKAASLSGIAIVHFFLNNYQESIKYDLMCIEIREQINNASDLVVSYSNIAETHIKLDDYAHAQKYLQRALKLVEKDAIEDLVTLAELHINLGVVNLRQDNLEDSLRNLRKGLELSIKGKSKYSECNVEHHLGLFFKHTFEHEVSIQHFEKSLQIAKDINSTELIAENHNELYLLYKELKNHEKALQHCEQYNESKEKLLKQESKNSLVLQEYKMELLSNQQQRKSIDEQNKALKKAHDTLKVLAGVGKEIISHLSIEDIIDKTYKNVNRIMDASVFGIGVYEEDEDSIYFPYLMEKGEPLPSHKYPLSNKERPAVWCFENQKEIIINDRETDYKKYMGKAPSKRIGDVPQSVLYFPITTKEKKIGVVTVQSFIKNSYTPYHLEILSNIALYAAIALENARLYADIQSEVIDRTQEIKNAYNNVRLLGNIGQHIISSLNFETIFNDLREHVNKLMDATVFGVRIYHPELDTVEYKYEIERGERHEPEHISMKDDDNFTVWCIKNRKPILIYDNEVDYKKYTSKIVVVSGDMPNSLIFCPMTVGEKLIGVITVQSFEKNAYSEYHLSILRTLATYTAIALENASLYNSLEEKVKERTFELEEKNNDILDSITYAKRIQNALLEEEEHVTSSLPAHFIYFKPKDIVSGDFYWGKRLENYWYTAVVDCTGHGVPGAFMSVLGIASLNEIFNSLENPTPAEILDRLKKKIVNDLSQKGRDGDSYDGMDISMARLNLETFELNFAGANNPLYLIQDEKIRVIKGTKQPIGYTEAVVPFTNHTFQLKQGDTYYLFSDGFADQFGGQKGSKYNYKRFRDFLKSNYFRHMKIQKVLINEEFEKWRQDEEQVDDICVVGIKIDKDQY